MRNPIRGHPPLQFMIYKFDAGVGFSDLVLHVVWVHLGWAPAAGVLQDRMAKRGPQVGSYSGSLILASWPCAAQLYWGLVVLKLGSVIL